ncbi:retrovirus-related Pol polyprotein from transposon 297 [Trichonephila clavipes]|nr:retrovirus-related Pol polyprotein from transposon 297 [Trichonephila clavipes]
MKLSMTATSTNTGAAAAEKINIQHLIPRFVENSDISTYLKIFERQCEQVNIGEVDYVTHLLPMLPINISHIILREPKDKLENYQHIKQVLLQRFKLSTESFRMKFSTHLKQPEALWKDFAYELNNYLEGWLHSLEVKDFNSLKDLVLTDQLKKRVAKEVKEHFVDIWGDIKSSSELVQKLDDYEVVRSKTSNHKVLPDVRTSFHSKINKQIRTVDKAKEEPRKSFRGHSQFESRNLLSCYGCGKPGYIKSKCPDCNPLKGDPAHFVILRINSLSPSNRNAVLGISINRVSGTAFADSGASHSIAGETLYTILLQQGSAFEKTVISLSFVDGIVTQKEVLRTFQTVILEGRKFKTPFIILPDAKNNSTLLGVDFLENAGIVLNFRKNCWTFCDDSRKSYNFVTPYHNTSVNVRPVAINNCQLREDEGQELLGSQRAELDSLLRNHHSIFEVGGEATPFIEHSINTENNPPISVPPYRMNPARKELLKKELDSLLQQGIIVECESPYASPVVLIPKPNGSMRLCIDYRKLNAQTVPDSYPLPRMDNLLNKAKPTPYMSTIDLRSGYHQVKVAAEDQDKTTFTCPFGIYKFTRMPFGLRNAPATFQRLIDKLRSGLNNVLALSYLDDIIILSPTFQKHLSDLEQVFKCPSLFKLNANREKCNFCCKKVKYLGHYITKEGISVDPQKTAAIVDMSSPTAVKQIQSFVQIRYIPNFSQIAKPLTDLTKKNAMWEWGSEQEEAFRDLKLKLASPPVLKPADAKLSTTEREALAVVWSLEKFRGYVEGQTIRLSSDHQPLKWLLSLKSPTGRLARWALQIQSYNLTIDYIPGRSNFIADLLSRPTSEQEKADCDILAVSVDFPTRSPKEVREEQLKDDELKKIIECFENNEKSVNFANWLKRGYLMNQGILLRYSPTSESEEAQLVVPIHERQDILKIHHDAPNAGHYGADGTFERISKRYY